MAIFKAAKMRTLAAAAAELVKPLVSTSARRQLLALTALAPTMAGCAPPGGFGAFTANLINDRTGGLVDLRNMTAPPPVAPNTSATPDQVYAIDNYCTHVANTSLANERLQDGVTRLANGLESGVTQDTAFAGDNGYPQQSASLYAGQVAAKLDCLRREGVPVYLTAPAMPAALPYQPFDSSMNSSPPAFQARVRQVGTSYTNPRDYLPQISG